MGESILEADQAFSDVKLSTLAFKYEPLWIKRHHKINPIYRRLMNIYIYI